MAIRHFRGAVPEERVQVVCNSFVSRFEESLDKK